LGYTGGGDTLTQVELRFPSLHAAVRHAKRLGVPYVVHHHEGRSGAQSERAGRDFSDATLQRLGMAELEGEYGMAMEGASDRKDPQGASAWRTPIDVARDGKLSLEAKRSILMNWAWTEYLIDQTTAEGKPDPGQGSRLHEVEQALVALESEAEAAANPQLSQAA